MPPTRDTLGTLEEAPAIMAALPIGHLNVLSELSAAAGTSRRSRRGFAAG
jgi:hypothetical protein